MRKSTWACLFVAGLLSACQQADQTASSGSDDPTELMQVAFPGWQATGSNAIRRLKTPGEGEASTGSAGGEDDYAVAPALVLKPDADHAILVFKGGPSDAQGQSTAGHASPAALGAAWFARRDRRWYQEGTLGVFAMEGFFGEPGDLKPVSLGNGRVMLAVENGSCWQGACGRWLSLYLAGEGKTMSKVYGDLLSSDSEGASASCGDLLKLASGERQQVSTEEYSSAFGCYRIEGRWQIGPSTSGPGELVIDFGGKKTVEREIPDDASNDADSGNDDSGNAPLLVVLKEIHERQVLNFIGGKYAPASGNNPNPGL